MNITRDDIIHVADLARLDMDEESIQKFTVQIDDILKYIETLNNLDTEGVLPTSHAIVLTNAFRDDVIVQNIKRDALLENAPEDENGSFMVPKVVG
ncbi:Asp-tRNA(Asn)/Glu-tRNA(Gln) amidotransferase subunit GatC [Desulfobacterium sp. N47]|uniref:Aspartyl/glutamyl-tRNA(Asn/Gln) amidotransferase subunit C n=1 Tax=uncultured Desulfobacterium sp. TaxID=201089 RepID=E1YFN3_9BACT|nr:Aspartyl/glutamyl-tRNA(Asn/Gln) amidotransferase subunit C [uncultured Desulfobacterium sp.]